MKPETKRAAIYGITAIIITAFIAAAYTGQLSELFNVILKLAEKG